MNNTFRMQSKKFVVTSVVSSAVLMLMAHTARSDEGEDLATWTGHCEVALATQKLTGTCIGAPLAGSGHGLQLCRLKSSPTNCPTTTSVTDKTEVGCGASGVGRSVSPSHNCH